MRKSAVPPQNYTDVIMEKQHCSWWELFLIEASIYINITNVSHTFVWQLSCKPQETYEVLARCLFHLVKEFYLKLMLKVFSCCLSMMILLDVLKVMELRSTSFTKNSLSPKLVLRKFTPLRGFVLLSCFYTM